MMSATLPISFIGPATTVTPSNTNTTSPPRTLVEIHAEDTARISPNRVLQSRRDAGEPNVPLDETLLPSTPSACNSSSAPSIAQQWMESFATVSPNSKARAKQAFNTLKTTGTFSPTAPKVYYSRFSLLSLSTTPLVSGSIPPSRTWQTLSNTFLSFFFFTDESTKRLYREGHALKKVKSFITGTTYHLSLSSRR